MKFVGRTVQKRSARTTAKAGSRVRPCLLPAYLTTEAEKAKGKI